jgi:ubiquinone/menaquinone biosynthesis C-methylase UbiE
MGSNFTDYIKEAYRVLEYYGQIMIAESQNKWKGREDELIKILTDNGFSIIKNTKSSKFFYINAIKN